MAGALVVELVAAVGELALRGVLSGPIREWRLDSFYRGLDDAKRTAMLQVIAAAIVHDGQVSEFEKAWLEKRRESDREDAARVDSAVELATAELAGAQLEGYRAFVASRATLFSDEDDREHLLKAAFIILRAAAAQPEVFAAFGEGLGVSAARQSVIVARLDHLLS